MDISSSSPIRDSGRLKMKRNCNLELRLSQPPQQNLQQQITIFYDGQTCVCDVTELQASAIIWMASKQLDREKYRGKFGSASTLKSGETVTSPTSTLCTTPMKNSLQRFLQKRKNRRMGSSPYNRPGRAHIQD